MTSEDAVLAVLARRPTGKTICPSEAARLLAGSADWRAAMPEIHTAVDLMQARGDIVLSWKGERMERRGGPYRIARRSRGGAGG